MLPEELQSKMEGKGENMNDAISPAKPDANGQDARKAKRPKDTSTTRFNASKHGLLAQGITELDDADAYTALLERLNEAHQPAGDIETFLVERIALAIVRLRRIARMEAEYIRGELHPPVFGKSYRDTLRDSSERPLVDP